VDVDRIASRAGPAISAILRSPLHPLLSFGLMLISYEGRRTGQRHTFPVGYQRSGDTVTVLATRARRKNWWRNFREPRPARVLVRGHWYEGTGHALAGDSDEFREAIEGTFRRLPRLAGQFGIRYSRGRPISEDDWEVVALEGAAVTIQLSPGVAPAR
jgi:hypothetical protein